MYGSQRKGLRSAGGGSTSAAGSSQNFPSSSTASAVGSQLTSQLSQMQVVDDGSSDNEGGEEYGDMHRLVLQGVMAAGYLDAKGVKKLFQESCKQLKCKVPAAEHMSPTFIQKVVREINERIKIYDMMIRSATCEVTGEKFYVFLVTIEKQVMKLQTYFTKPELDLFQKILDAIVRKHRNFQIPMNECIEIAGELDPKAFNLRNAEYFIEKMIELQYFTKVGPIEDFDITLGFRTIREFEPVFREIYQDVFTTCCLCKMILLNGLKCPKCPAVIHRACLKKYIKNCKMCVTCKGPWRTEESLLVRIRDGEGEAPSARSSDHSANSRPSQDSSGGPPKKTRRTENGDEVDMPILEPMVSPRSAGTSQSQSSPKGKRKNQANKESPSKETSSPKSKKKPTVATRRTRNRVESSDSD